MDLSYHSRNFAKAESARARILRSGITPNGTKLWTDGEIRILRSCYPNVQEMMRRLPHRTYLAIVNQCARLGLKRGVHWWTGKDIVRLRRLYPNASHSVLHAEFPGRTWRAIEQAALKRGIRRCQRRFKRTGSSLIDGLLSRLEEIGWSLRDLDLESGTKRYFQNHGWRRYKLNLKALAKAVEVLDGNLEIAWRN